LETRLGASKINAFDLIKRSVSLGFIRPGLRLNNYFTVITLKVNNSTPLIDSLRLPQHLANTPDTHYNISGISRTVLS